MSNDNTPGLLANPLPIVLVALLAAGVLIKHDELKSSRPNDSERVKFVPAGHQDVEARLWQDPFAAVEKHNGRSATKTHGPERVRERIQTIGEKGGQVKILGISVFGGSYSEAAESRRRTRFAVLSALGFHGYSPANSDAIGYFRVELPPGDGKGVSWPTSVATDLDFNLIGPAGSTMLLEFARRNSEHASIDLTVPYEWFAKNSPASNVLVLWLNEEKLTAGALDSLPRLIAKLAPTRANPPRRLMRNRQQEPANDTPKIFVHSATIPNCDLDESTSLSLWNCFMENPLSLKELTKLPIIRTIGTDDVLAAALLWELWQRGINREPEKPPWTRLWTLLKGQKSADAPRDCTDGLVLISEWDSDYARALSRNLTDGFSSRCKSGGDFSPPVRSFNYLRGLDGMLPEVDKATANTPRKEDNGTGKDLWAQLEDAPPERAEGRSQYDYLRRLGDEISRLDSNPGFAVNGVQAIGIAGSDVYDKLLILQALRKRFKDKIFFTTDLDARYLHAEQKEWARNLVVASNFDLSLHPALQKSTPPFRDGYQTATYLATLMALETKSFKHWNGTVKNWLRPQIFEIGRTGAVHLASPSAEALTQWIQSGYSAGNAAAAEIAKCDDDWAACKNIEPARPSQGAGATSLFPIVLIIFLGTLSVALLSQSLQGSAHAAYNALSSHVPAEARVARIWLIVVAALVFVVAKMLVQVRQAMDASFVQGAGEPFVWLEGISVWPSVVLRFVGCVITIVLVIVSVVWIRRQAHLISKRFDLPLPRTWRLARNRWSAVAMGPHLDLASFGSNGKANLKPDGDGVEIASLWQNYLRATSWREMAGWILASTVIAFMIGVALFLFFADRPSFPHRGLLVETLYSWLTRVNALLLWLVIFWVGYETRACARFVSILSDVKSAWPKPLLDREEAATGVPRAHLDDYLDFRLIVAATRRIYRLIYLPFVLLLFLVLARSSLFDAMDFPLGLVFVTGLALAYALYTAIVLRRTAESARAKALEHYNARLLAQARLQDAASPAGGAAAATPTPISAEQIKLLMERIRNTREGAFASFTQQPALQALLLPFGGYGGVQLVEYLINF